MRRISKDSIQKLSADSQQLATLALAVVQTGSRLEERTLGHQLDLLLQSLLKADRQEIIDVAIDHLFKTKPDAYDALMEAVEAASESCSLEHDGKQYDALLIALPILAWTRFTIASGAIASDMLMTLSAHLYAHILADDTRMIMAPMLFAIDQLPRTHADTFLVTQSMAQAALRGSAMPAMPNPPETAPFLADTRYLLAAVVAPTGAPLFRWQASGNLAERDEALSQWRAQATPNLTRLLPGCGVELLLPEAYFVACREADKQIRPASIRAAIHYLTHALDIEPDQLSTVIGAFTEDSDEGRVDEYRISFIQQPNPDVIYGIVWPLYGAEEAVLDPNSTLGILDDSAIFPQAMQADQVYPLDEIKMLLKAAGIIHIKQHEEHFLMEFCDDCGTPLYCDLDAELVHAEMPEDAPHANVQLH